MTSGNTSSRVAQPTESASGNTGAPTAAADRTRGPITLPVELAAELTRYQRALARAPLAGATRAKYVARVRGFLVWLATSDLSGHGGADDRGRRRGRGRGSLDTLRIYTQPNDTDREHALALLTTDE